MKKVVLITVALGLVLSGCAGGKKFGVDCEKHPKDPVCKASSTLPASSSPTPTIKRSRTPKSSPTPTETQTQEPRRNPVTYSIVIRGGGQYFFLWKGGTQKEYTYADSGGPRVFIGDIIIFKNDDTGTNGTKHSWTSGENPSSSDFGKLFDSKLIAPGKTFKWIVTDDVGCYRYTDRYVQYIHGGPMEIVDPEKPATKGCK